MASLSDILTTIQQGVTALNGLVKQMMGSLNNIASQLSSGGPPNSVTNASLAQMPAFTVKANPTGSTANAQDSTSPVVSGSFTSTANLTGSSPLGSFIASSPNTSYFWNVTGQPTDQKNWDAAAAGTILQFRAVNDANTLANIWMTVTRGTGFTVSNVSFPIPVVLTSATAGNQTWLETLIPNTLSIANVSSVSPTGTIGLLGATRTLDSTLAGAQGALAVAGFGINNNNVQVQSAWAGYFESRRYSGAGYTLGVEIDALNLGSVIAIDPYNMVPVGITPALWLSSGRSDVIGVTNTTAAIGIINNGTSHNRGIVFASNSLDNSGGEGVAIGLPVNYGMTWFASAATPVARIRSDATTTSMSIIFGNGSLNVQLASGITNIFSIGSTGVVTAGGLNLIVTGAASATAGAASALPSPPASYIPIQVNGTAFKIAIYNP
jgi:hypothetical protein